MSFKDFWRFLRGQSRTQKSANTGRQTPKNRNTIQINIQGPDPDKIREGFWKFEWLERFFLTLGISYYVGLALILILSIFGALFVYPLARSYLTDARSREEVPAPTIVSVTAVADLSWWEQAVPEWLTSQEAAQLRDQENVINFTVLHADQVLYADNLSLQLTEEWTQQRPYFVEAASVNGTAAIVQISGQQFHLNIHQPFIWRSDPSVVLMLDQNGRLWTLGENLAVLIPIEGITLPLMVQPNPELELSFTKQ